MATNFLRFCRAGSVNGMAFAIGVSGVACGAGVGRMLIGSGTWIQIYGDWVKGKPLVLFPCSLSFAFPCFPCW